LPKRTDFAIISPSELKTIENLLNNKPRKCLNFKTPAEVFSSYVALAGLMLPFILMNLFAF